YMIDEKYIIGKKDMDQVLPIASVSKVFTTQWALAVLGPDYRFHVNVYMTPRNNKPGVWNVHLSSDHHPYFDKTLFYKIAEYLVSRGIKNVETMTFDEGVRFVWDAESKCAVACDHPLGFPTQDEVKNAFGVFKGKQLKIGTIRYWASRNADKVRGFRPIKNLTQQANFYSDPMVDVLHRMNANSNNHAANQIFYRLGGKPAYAQFSAKTFSFKPGQLVLNNGSGNPVSRDGHKYYNRATSAVVVQAIAYIHAFMKYHGGITRVLALAAPDENNTLGAYSVRTVLQDKLVAKTGSVFEAITLAGVLSTKRGPMAFYFNIDTNSKRDWRSARSEIRAYLTGIIEYLGPGPDIK
ncbi:MAG: D-alanyl-D-alanine carboxypeptidase, partial [Bdellovibrionota bacterium]